MAENQIFVTYAWDDNLPPPAFPDRKGFVGYLQDYLNYKFRTSGPLRPNIWRDKDNIPNGAQFPQHLKDEIDKSAYLLVVLSKNWLDSENCRNEFDYFRASCVKRNVPADERIILIEKHPIDRPAGFPSAVGYKFYGLTDSKIRPFEEFFGLGEPSDQWANRYWREADDLIAYLLAIIVRDADAKDKPAARPTIGRTVFVAKPASDMREQYGRLVAELEGKGYAVVPERIAEIPDDGTAEAFIDAQLAKAELSIHLLGDSSGWNTVNMQLARAAAKVSPDAANGGGTANLPFQRIIWAPKIFQPDPRPGGATSQRQEPHEVLTKFCKQDCDGDIIHGDDFGTFRGNLVSYLDRRKLPRAPSPDDAVALAPGKYKGKVYVLHDEPDRELARHLKRALWKFDVEAVLPFRDGDEVPRRNMLQMQACDGVVICWGSTTEQWTITQARQLENWREMGREQNWEPRGIVVGPPLDPPLDKYKREFKEDGPPNEVDAVVWVRDLESIPPDDDLRKLVPRRPPA